MMAVTILKSIFKDPESLSQPLPRRTYPLPGDLGRSGMTIEPSVTVSSPMAIARGWCHGNQSVLGQSQLGNAQISREGALLSESTLPFSHQFQSSLSSLQKPENSLGCLAL